MPTAIHGHGRRSLHGRAARRRTSCPTPRTCIKAVWLHRTAPTGTRIAPIASGLATARNRHTTGPQYASFHSPAEAHNASTLAASRYIARSCPIAKTDSCSARSPGRLTHNHRVGSRWHLLLASDAHHRHFPLVVPRPEIAEPRAS